MQVQMKMLGCGNHDNFTKNLQVPHVEVNGKTLGVIGAGHIGRKVIQIAQALDMNILVYSRTPREDEKGIHYVSLEELLKNSDYVSLHCPLTESTRHMINKETLSLMKPTAFLINTSRGTLDAITKLSDAKVLDRGSYYEIRDVSYGSLDYGEFYEDNLVFTKISLEREVLTTEYECKACVSLIIYRDRDCFCEICHESVSLL